MISRPMALTGLVALTMGCAAGANSGARPGPPGGSTRPTSSRDVLTGLEIQENAPAAANAFQAIQRLRNSWIRRGIGTTSLQGATPVRIYVDNIPVNNAPTTGSQVLDLNQLEALQSYPVERIYEIRYYDARDATQRWGTNHTGGAIELITGTPGVDPTQARPRPADQPVTDDQVNPAMSFSPGVIYYVNSGAATITAPEEVASVWEPSVNFGVGVGVRTSSTVILFAAVEVNRFGFSPSRVLEYFANRSTGRLQGTAGAEAVGEPSTILNLSANLKVHPRRGLFRPFLVGGFGYSRFTAGAFRVSGPGGTPLPRQQFALRVANGGNQVENGFSVGGGVGFDIVTGGRLGLFADARYITAIRGPRYRDVYDRFQLFNTGYYPFRIGLSYR